MGRDAPSLSDLEALARSADVRDRAFASSALSLIGDAADQTRVLSIYERIAATADEQHAEVRRRLRDGSLDRRALFARLAGAPPDVRDHLVEEILGIAYPPLDLSRSALPRDSIEYVPSGLSEILFMIERADLGPDRRFVDLGSGLGKVLLVVALLTGARCYGVELDPRLVALARAASESLALGGVELVLGDLREVALPVADVYYMYVPVFRSVEVAARLEAVAARRDLLLFAQPLDLEGLPWLRAAGGGSYWLGVYEARRAPARDR